MLIAGVLVAVFLVIGLTQLGGTSSEGGGGKAPSADAARQQLAGSPQALADLHTNASKLIQGRDYKAQVDVLKGYPIVVNIWGSWCIPCRQEFPVFQRVSAKLGKRVAFLGIDTQDPTEDARKFLDEHPLSYPSYVDLDGSLAKSFGIIGTPSTIYYDKNGKQTYLHQGPSRKVADLEGDIEKYTSES
jgi:cytochrome c biogenesis protein CcmG/thiol:disulfide interchange protein DsbE